MRAACGDIMAERQDKERGKALLIVRIIQILRRESDEEHPVSQQRILELLAERYGMTVDRKSIRRNLLRLAQAGFPVYSREGTRRIRGRTEAVSLGWYWKHAVSGADAGLLEDALQFSPLPALRVRQLAEKLKRFSSRHGRSGAVQAKNLPRPDAQALAERQKETAALLTAAIAEKKKILCWTDHFEADGKWHHDRTGAGEERRLKLNPYALFAACGQYVLLANPDGEETARLYRLSRLSGVELTDEAARPQKSVDALEGGLAASAYLDAAETVYLEPPARCTLDMQPEALTSLAETFGKRARVLSATINSVQAEVEAAPGAVAAWALPLGGRVKVTGPPHLVRAMKDTAAALARLYGGGV